MIARACLAATAAPVLAALVLAAPAAAEATKVHMGVTPGELAAVLSRAGYQPEKPVTPAQRQLAFRRKTGGSASLRLTLLDCDAANRCATGYVEAVTYLMVPDWHARHWNGAHHGAVSYNAMYHSLKRPLHFRGVTDVYLREVLTEVWPRAYEAYWREGRKVMGRRRTTK